MSLAAAPMGGRSTTSSPCRSELPLRPPLAPSCSLFVFGGQDLSAWSMPRSSHHTVAERVMWISQPSLQAALTLAALFLLPSLILFRSLLHSSSSTLHASSLHRLHHLLCPRYHDTTAVGVLWGAFFDHARHHCRGTAWGVPFHGGGYETPPFLNRLLRLRYCDTPPPSLTSPVYYGGPSSLPCSTLSAHGHGEFHFMHGGFDMPPSLTPPSLSTPPVYYGGPSPLPSPPSSFEFIPPGKLGHGGMGGFLLWGGYAILLRNMGGTIFC